MHMTHLYDLSAPKKPTNLTVNTDLLAQAKALGINLSAVLEQSLIQEVRRLKADAWRRENQGAVQAYNQDIKKRGTFADELRAF